MFHTTYERTTTETHLFDVLMNRIESDRELFDRAEAMLHAVSVAEPLMAQSLQTPQDVRYHAEGPFVRDHLRLMLMSLYAIEEGTLHLTEIEELARLKGYEHEVEELEQTFREHTSWFEAFILVHDVAKWNTIAFRSPKGSRGDRLGFNVEPTYQPDDDAIARMKIRTTYLETYNAFVATHTDEPAREVQSLFYQTYEIDVKYPHHDRMTHTPVYEQLLHRFAIAHELTDIHTSMLEDIVGRHLDFARFKRVDAVGMKPFLHLARVRGYDGDDFVDFIQGAMFLDFVCGSIRLSPHGYWHEIEMLVNALRAEHEADPGRRAQKLAAYEQEDHRRSLRLFQEVGLDGLSLMDVLGMEPGPEFGTALRRIQSAVLGRSDMPTFGKKIDEEIQKRAGEYYKKAFDVGE